MSVSKLGYAVNWATNAYNPRSHGVSSVVFVPHDLENYKPDARLGEICMAFMHDMEPEFYSTKLKGSDRGYFEDGDWLFWMSPFEHSGEDDAKTNKFPKSHMAYVEHIMSDKCRPLKYFNKPSSWSWVINEYEGNCSGLVFVQDNLHFNSKEFFFVNTLIRALWEYPEHVDKWVELVDAGVDKDEALYFMWVNQGFASDGKYTYGFYSTGHSPFDEQITWSNFLEGTPEYPAECVFSNEGWETGIQNMWGQEDDLSTLLGLSRSRYSYEPTDKDLITLILERNK